VFIDVAYDIEQQIGINDVGKTIVVGVTRDDDDDDIISKWALTMALMTGVMGMVVLSNDASIDDEREPMAWAINWH